MLISRYINSQRIVVFIMYKHSFYARKVVCDERNEREKREESSVTLGLNTLNTKKKENLTSKITSKAVSALVVVVVVKKREGKRESKLWYDRKHPSLFLVVILPCFFYYSFLLQTTTTKFDCVMTHRLGNWILFCAFKTTTRFGRRRLLLRLSVVLSLFVSLPLTTNLFLLLLLLIRHRNRLLLLLKIRSLRTEMKKRKLRSTRFQSSRKEKPSTETHHINTNF